MSSLNDSESKLNKMTPYNLGDNHSNFPIKIASQMREQPKQLRLFDLRVQYPPCPTNYEYWQMSQKKRQEKFKKQQSNSLLSNIVNWIYPQQKQEQNKTKNERVHDRQQEQVPLFDENDDYNDSQQERQREELQILKARIHQQEARYGKNPEAYLSKLKDKAQKIQEI